MVEPALEFGERIHLRPALAQEPRSGLQPRMIEGRYVCGTSFQDRKHPCDDERSHRERSRLQPKCRWKNDGTLLSLRT